MWSHAAQGPFFVWLTQWARVGLAPLIRDNHHLVIFGGNRLCKKKSRVPTPDPISNHPPTCHSSWQIMVGPRSCRMRHSDPRPVPNRNDDPHVRWSPQPSPGPRIAETRRSISFPQPIHPRKRPSPNASIPLSWRDCLARARERTPRGLTVSTQERGSPELANNPCAAEACLCVNGTWKKPTQKKKRKNYVVDCPGLGKLARANTHVMLLFETRCAA